MPMLDAFTAFLRRLRAAPGLLAVTLILLVPLTANAINSPQRAHNGAVTSQSGIASEVGAQVLRDGGNAMDAAVATAFALAVTHPTAGNIGGGGFLIWRDAKGRAQAYDFRELAPAALTAESRLKDGEFDFYAHHLGHKAVGVPGTVAGLHMAWQDEGSKPWAALVEPAIRLAADGFVVSDGLARSLARALERQMKPYAASQAKFTNDDGNPYAAGELFRQPDLAAALARIAEQGPKGFYEGTTAELIVQDMEANGGLMTLADLKNYRAKKRTPIRGSYRGYEIIGMPPPSSGGIVMVEMLNILEGYDLAEMGFGSARTIHRMAEAMRRAYADRARHLGDPDFNPDIPVRRLTSKDYADELRATIRPDKATDSDPDSFEWTAESEETTHFSVVDADRNAVSLTYTLEFGYGSGIVVPGGGFLLNNELGDFNGKRGLTDARGLIGTAPNMTEPRKRPLSSMSPTIVAKDGELFMATGSPGGRTIINTVMQTIINVVDHGMNAQEAVDAGRIHHQWLPDRISMETYGFSPDTQEILRWLGHDLTERARQGSAQVILVRPDDGMLEIGTDKRSADAGAGLW